MELDSRQKEEQLLIRSIHSAHTAKNVLSRNVGVLIKDPTYKLIAETVVQYYATTDEPLSLNALNLKVEERLKRQAERSNATVPDNVLNGLFQTTSNLINAKEDNNTVVLTELENYVHTQLGNQAIIEEATKGSDHISERVEKRMAKINEIKLTGTDYEVIDIFKDLARKEAIYDEFGNRKLSSGLKPLDVVTGGGLETGQIAVINAPSGRGKSSFLSNLTYYYSMIAHHNVLHITLEELNTDQILRFDRIITNSDIHDVFTPDGEIREDYKERVHNYYSKVNENQMVGNVYYAKSTPLTWAVDDVRQVINKVEREKQTKIEVVILDYADLLIKKQYSDNEAQAGELLYQDLVRLAQETDTLIFTASQLNRGSGIAEIKTMENVEGSYRKKNTIAFGATLNSTPEEYKKGYIRLYLDKVRNNFGFDDNFMYLRYDLKSMRLHPESKDEQADHLATLDESNTTHSRPNNKIDKNAELIQTINDAISPNK